MTERLYLRTLLDPFDRTVEHPKILDARLQRSAGIRLRDGGTFPITTTGNAEYFCLIPSCSTNLSWITWNGTAYTQQRPGAYVGHADTAANRDNIKQWRLVNAGIKLSLLNAEDSNDGWWEAIRVPFSQVTYTFTADKTHVEVSTLNDLGTFAEYPSYRTGLLKDLHHYLFKLNGDGVDHDFLSPTAVDENFDAIIIKIYGRTSSPASLIKYDVTSSQELEYPEGTSLGRLLTNNHSPFKQNEHIMARAKVLSSTIKLS